CQWISAKCTCLINWSFRSKHIHYILPSSIGPYRQSTTYDLAHSCKVRHNAIEFLGTSGRYTEPTYHLIKDQQGSILACQFPKSLQKALFWQDHSHISGNRFHDNSCYILTVCIKEFTD